MKRKPYQTSFKSVSLRTSMAIRRLRGILLGPVLALLRLVHCPAGNLEYGIGTWEVPSSQPVQMRSQVDYDPKLRDPFFVANEWSYPWWIVEHPDGHFESTRGIDESPVKDPPRLKHTAKCFSSSFGGREHRVRFCEARLLDMNVVNLLIHEKNPAYRDALKVQIRNGNFTCQYWTRYVAGPPPDGYVWTTKRQKLTLDKKSYRKGDVIKGRIDFECVEEVTDPEEVEKYGRLPTTIKVHGVFKTIVE